ncbi:peptide-binding protein [Caldalkalibacillus mannanilyticus]|uniref:peptide-binding protein n=1 Tax=Caldalkalibacillus mannanilyticus TaxID=1418 RepID=UPI000AFA4D37|nr:peptide-binding protein [Caldalkalibacillus mannanilyticus]
MSNKALSKKKVATNRMVFILILIVMLTACTTGQQVDKQEHESSPSSQEGEKRVPGEPKYGGTLIFGTASNPTLFTPNFASDMPSRVIANRIFSGLITMDHEFNPVGDLAERWEYSEDGTIWTFYLKENVKWHDGETFTADDVVFSYSIPMHEDYSGPYSWPYQKIVAVNKVDDYTVEFILEEPYAPFLAISAQTGIVPKHILEDIPIAEIGKHEFGTKKPIGTGPFKFEEWREGEYVALTAFEDYYQGRPYIDNIVFKIVQDTNTLMAQVMSGDIHFAGVTPSYIDTVTQLENKGQIVLLSGPTNSWEYIGYNLRNPLFQDKNVRAALTHAIDKEAIVQTVVNGRGAVAHGPGSPANWAFNPNLPSFEYHPEKTKQLLHEAGWKAGADGILEKDGTRFSFTLTTSQGGETRPEIAAIVQQQLRLVGIEVDIQLLEWSAYIAQTGPPNWDFDALVAGWSIGSDPDPTYFWHSNQIEQGLNYFGYSNLEVDKLLDLNTTILNQEERKEVIYKADELVTLDQPYTFLYYPEGFIAHIPQLIGPKYSVSNTYYKIHEWWLDQE